MIIRESDRENYTGEIVITLSDMLTLTSGGVIVEDTPVEDGKILMLPPKSLSDRKKPRESRRPVHDSGATYFAKIGALADKVIGNFLETGSADLGLRYLHDVMYYVEMSDEAKEVLQDYYDRGLIND